MLPLLLASSSPYRRELLARLHLPFTWASPNLDERRLENEPPTELVRRLARQKAEALASNHPNHLIIGSDQVAVLGEQILGKPHTFERACEQLLETSGQQVTFLTGLALLNSATGQCQVDCVPFTVTLRALTREQVERYVTLEQPLDCAGSFKAEGLGVSLFESTHGCDSTSLIGLPLIRLVDMLRQEGAQLP